MTFAPWYERFPRRLIQERERYAEKGLQFSLAEDLLASHHVVVFDGQFEVEGKQCPLRVVYPSGFPYVRPEVICPDVRLPRHQNPYDANLCVIPNDPDAWSVECRGADMVLQAIRLLQANHQGPAVVAAQEVDAPEPASTWYSYAQGASFIMLEDIPTLEPGDFGSFTVSLRSPYPGGPGLQAVLTQVQSARRGVVWRISEPLKQVAGGQPHTGDWVSVEERPPYLRTTTNERAGYAEYREWLCSQHKDLRYRLGKQRGPTCYGVIYPDEGPGRGQTHQNWLVGLAMPQSAEPILLRPFLWTDADYFSRIPGLQGLQHMKVLIVGLGALGSPVVRGLARAGVGRLGLVDFDMVEPGPLVRQEYDLRDVGLPKVQAVEWLARYINPRISIEVFPYTLGGANLDLSQSGIGPDQVAHFAENVRQYDLLISTTGQLSVDMIINEIARAYGRPAVFTWVYNGARGGRVFRSRPGQACFECLRYCPLPLPNEDPSDLPLYVRGCGYPTFTGTGFDSATVAELAVRSAVQTMLSGEPGTYPDVPGNLINCSNRGSEVGEYPQMEHLTVPRQEKCWTCHHYEN